MEEYFSDLLIEENKAINIWFANLMICNNYQKFKISQKVNNIVINHKRFRNFRNRPTLRPPEERFRSPGARNRVKENSELSQRI